MLKAFSDGQMQTAGTRVLIVRDDKAVDAATGEAVAPLPDSRDDVVVNNRLRGEIDRAIAGLRLTSPDRSVRQAAVRELRVVSMIQCDRS